MNETRISGSNPEDQGREVEMGLSEVLKAKVNEAISMMLESNQEQAVLEMNGMTIRSANKPIADRNAFAVYEYEGKKYLIYT